MVTCSSSPGRPLRGIERSLQERSGRSGRSGKPLQGIDNGHACAAGASTHVGTLQLTGAEDFALLPPKPSATLVSCHQVSPAAWAPQPAMPITGHRAAAAARASPSTCCAQSTECQPQRLIFCTNQERDSAYFDSGYRPVLAGAAL